MKGLIFDIQNYAIYDGPGIRTAVYFKGCPLSCWWCHNPESQSRWPEMAHWAERCAGCGKCVEACQRGALSMVAGRVQRDYNRCVTCWDCTQACPNKAMERIGREVEVDEIVERVMRDQPFYDNSGGGVTITGGEPTYQSEFLLEVLAAIKDNGVHTAIETCGAFSWNLIDKLVERVDLFLFDLKHVDYSAHAQGTGMGNDEIKKNFRALLKRAGAGRVIPRIPLVPGLNTCGSAIDEFIEFLESEGYKGPVHLMPYHGWARGKYERLGRIEAFKDPGQLREEELEEISGRFSSKGFETVLYG